MWPCVSSVSQNDLVHGRPSRLNLPYRLPLSVFSFTTHSRVVQFEQNEPTKDAILLQIVSNCQWRKDLDLVRGFGCAFAVLPFFSFLFDRLWPVITSKKWISYTYRVFQLLRKLTRQAKSVTSKMAVCDDVLSEFQMRVNFQIGSFLTDSSKRDYVCRRRTKLF